MEIRQFLDHRRANDAPSEGDEHLGTREFNAFAWSANRSAPTLASPNVQQINGVHYTTSASARIEQGYIFFHIRVCASMLHLLDEYLRANRAQIQIRPHRYLHQHAICLPQITNCHTKAFP
jgi:hypothetical protein